MALSEIWIVYDRAFNKSRVVEFTSVVDLNWGIWSLLTQKIQHIQKVNLFYI